MVRSYRQGQRARELEARRQAAIEAAISLWGDGGLDDITLQAVADRAGLSLKSVVRYFGSKDGLLRACMEVSVGREEGARDVPVGDVGAVAEVLAQRYELIADRVVKNADAEFRYPVMSEWVARARRSHREWLARAFAPWLPARGRERELRLGALFWATEVRCWWTLRFALGFDRKATTAVLRSQLEALVASWSKGSTNGRTR